MTEQQQHDEFEYAPGWRPQPGDRVVGPVSNIDTTDRGNGPYAVVTVLAEAGSTSDGKPVSGEIAVHAFHTVLRRELAQRRPKVGTRLAILYVGKKQDGGSYGRGYDMYRVKSDSVGYDWSRDAPDDDADGSSVPIEPEPVSQEVAAVGKAAEGTSDDDSDLPF